MIHIEAFEKMANDTGFRMPKHIIRTEALDSITPPDETNILDVNENIIKENAIPQNVELK